MAGKKLYFVALIPPEDLNFKVKALKEEIREKYNAKHALKLPAHITLQPPVSLSLQQEPGLFAALDAATKDQNVFRVDLSGFGSFPPHVIYIRVQDHEPIKTLHAQVLAGMEKILLKDNKSIHPHMTLASRDLKRKDFQQAWKEFAERHFQDSFLADKLFLLRHNGKTWDIIRNFPFGGN